MNFNTIKAHNIYHFKKYDKNGNLLEEKRFFNNAVPVLFALDYGNSSSSGAPLTLYYHPKVIETVDGEPSEKIDETVEYNVSTYVQFSKVPGIYAFGYGITFKGVAEFAGSWAGRLTHAGLGRGFVRGTGEDTHIDHWSEVSSQITKEENTTIILEVTLEISTVYPTGLTRYYGASISSLIQQDRDVFPMPGVGYFGFSSMPIYDSLPNPLQKRFPVIFSGLKSETETKDSNDRDVFIVHQTNTTKEGFFLNKNDCNFGYIPTFVYGDVGVVPLSGGFDNSDGNSGDNYLNIPIIELTKQKIFELLEINPADIENLDEYIDDIIPNKAINGAFYFFYVLPPGTTLRGCTDNGTETNDLEFFNPVRKLPASENSWQYGMNNDDSPTFIGQYRNTNNGTYYAPFIFSNDTYWEPPSNALVCPRYVYFNSDVPKFIYTGENCSVTIEYQNSNNEWIGLIQSSRYDIVTVPNVPDNISVSNYRAIVSAPDANSLNYFITPYESRVISSKCYDPNVLFFSDQDLHEVGLKVPVSKIKEWAKNAATTIHTLGIDIDVHGFYKTNQNVASLTYGIEVQGI